jgi:hypothetical protein
MVTTRLLILMDILVFPPVIINMAHLVGGFIIPCLIPLRQELLTFPLSKNIQGRLLAACI